ncbi:hypothetical protein HPB48_011747 [Haemaphysalis longicornis]|uniref:Uncharacterized protein n=1 Tax=Haemaphysalis longicornis TaxID=44386 RepID=A0A9J6H3K4_HAELO|nr:hypothetical protein HPB48_011747 [Haemaphysalis longicornis]
MSHSSLAMVAPTLTNAKVPAFRHHHWFFVQPVVRREATDRGNNSVPSAVQQGLQAVLPQGGGSDANGTVGSAEEGERVLGHLVSLMERLSHVPYLGALSRGPLHGTRENKLREAVDELKVGARDNATLRVTLYESPQEGGE